MGSSRSSRGSRALAKGAPSVPSARSIDQAARDIRALHRLAGLRLAWAVGDIVVCRFFGGDSSMLRERGPKDASLRKLAEHPELPLSATALYRAIGVYELLERFGGVSTWQHLTPSHMRVVLCLPDSEQESLLRRADRQRWTVGQLEAQAAGLERKRSKGGRPTLPAFVKSIRALRRYVDQPDAHFADLDQAAHLGDEEREQLCAVVQQLRARCEQLEAKLAAPRRKGSSAR